MAVAAVSFTVHRGEVLALLGPSGCGKTTTLRLIAGFDMPDAGSVQIDGREVVSAQTFVPPERRRVGMVFQDYALFPHLTVAGNVRYGLAELDTPSASPSADTAWWKRLGRWMHAQWDKRPVLGMGHHTAAQVRAALDLVALPHMADRYPHELSGGEAQRVALARALAPGPALILLDEPFSNLDTRLRAAVRRDVRRILERVGAAAVFVTHDQDEAFSLADRVAVMLHGRIEQIGRPQEIYQTPASRAVAEFIGSADFLPGLATPEGIVTEVGVLPIAGDLPSQRVVDVLLRPESISVEAAASDSSDPAVADVIDRQYYGHDQVITAQLPTKRIVHARLGPADDYGPGDRVRIAVRGLVIAYPRQLPHSDGLTSAGPS